MTHVAIMGLGLMGGSLGRALKQRQPGIHVTGYARRQEICEAAREAGAVDLASTDPAAVVAGADVVVICLPVLVMADLAARFRDALKPGAIVTDVGSTKQQVCEALTAVLAGSPGMFIGSHPIAGSEQAGFEAARGDLYDGATVVITPADAAPPAAVAALAQMWRGVGGLVIAMAPGRHDSVMARSSHLPHLVAAALVDAVGRECDAGDDVALFCGTGFEDTSRIAEGNESLWHDIVKSNAPAVLEELDAVSASLQQLRDAIAEGRFDQVRDYLAASRLTRSVLIKERASRKQQLAGPDLTLSS